MNAMSKESEQMLNRLARLAYMHGHRVPLDAIDRATRELNFGLQRAPKLEEVIRHIIKNGDPKLAGERRAERERIRREYEIPDKPTQPKKSFWKRIFGK